MPIRVEGFTLEKFDAFEKERFLTFHVATAEEALRSNVARGFDNEPVVITDGRPRQDYRGVKLFGVIEFAARPVMKDAVTFALHELARISPRLTGRYVRSHAVMINGGEITGDIDAALAAVKPGDRVQIVNTVPYARKIEGATASKRTGRGARKGSSRQAKGGVYRVVHRLLLQRFGRTMFFDYRMVKLNLGVKVWGAQGGSRQRTKHRLDQPSGRRRVLRDQVYPAIQFFIKDTGRAAT